MARALMLFIEPARLPGRAALQAAIDPLRLGLKLDGDWPPATPNAYLPCTVQGEDAGMYVNITADAAWPEAGAASADQQGARSTCVALRWGGDPREALAATVLAAALVEGCDALAIEPERGVRKSISSLKAHARELAENSF